MAMTGGTFSTYLSVPHRSGLAEKHAAKYFATDKLMHGATAHLIPPQILGVSPRVEAGSLVAGLRVGRHASRLQCTQIPVSFFAAQRLLSPPRG